MMRAFREFWREQDAQSRWRVTAGLLLMVLDDVANMLLGAAMIVIVGDVTLAWPVRLAALVSILALYAAVKVAAFGTRSAVETDVFAYRYRRISDFGDLVMDTDYERLQSGDEQTRIDKASSAVFSAGNRGLEYQVNQQLQFVAHLCSIVLGVVVLAMLDMTALIIVVAANALNMLLLGAESRWVQRDESELSTRQAKQNLLFGQECDKARRDDIAYSRLLPWLLHANRRNTDDIIGSMRRIERLRAATNAASGTIAFVSILAVILSAATHGVGTTSYAVPFLYIMLCVSMASAVHGAYETVRNLQRNAPVMRDWYAYVDGHSTDGNGGPAGTRGVETMPARPTVVFHGIGYRPSSDMPDILHDVDITYRFGQSIAFVGNNGAGKTTLVNVIAGLLRPTAGTISIDGRDVDYDEYRAFARARVSMLPQDNSLFSLTIADNLRLGMDADDGRLRDVLHDVGLLEKVESLPHGMDTYLGTDLDDDGTQLSGGQKRSLLVARVLLHPQDVCVFDEPTSAFDPVKEGEFYAMMAGLAGQRTLMFVSHNVGTTNFCDMAYVLDAGTVVQSGDPKQLIDGPGAYRDLFAGQRDGGKDVDA